MSAGKLTEQAKGVYIIAATPFTDDGALDLQSVDTLTDFYLGCGVHGFTLLGIMGEAHKLTTEESIDVVKRVIARGGNRQVIVGVSHAGIENVRRLAHEVMIAGAAGVTVAPPAGLKGDDGIYNYYAQVCAELGHDIPVVYQDYPQATGVYLPPTVFERLVDDFRQLVMLKHEDAPGLAKLTRIREGEKKPGRRRVSILVGNGGLHYPQELRRGADGAMTGFAWPEMLVEVYDLFTAGKVEEAEDLFDIYLSLVRHEVQPGIGLGAVPPRCHQESEATRARVVADGDRSHRTRLPHCATRAATRGRGTRAQGGGVVEECPITISSFATPRSVTSRRSLGLPRNSVCRLCTGSESFAMRVDCCAMAQICKVQFRRYGYFIDKVLKGTKPGDIPIEEPITFELIVNNRVAKSFDLTLPMSFLISADELIEVSALSNTAMPRPSIRSLISQDDLLPDYKHML